jgi:hypothetical protein
MEILIAWIIFAGLVWIIADVRGRIGFGYFVLSLLLSPLIGLILVLCLPNKTRQRAEEQRHRELLAAMRQHGILELPKE